jgi:hypothetical protein
MEQFEFSEPIKNETFSVQNAEAIEKWDREYAEIKYLKDEILQEIDSLAEKGIINFEFGSFYFVQNIVVPELEKIAGEKNYKNYAASHLFIGSSTKFDKTPEVDLPDRQIYNFLNTLLKRFNMANKEGKLEL